MSVVSTILGALFGNGRNALAETAEVFHVNAEKEAERGAVYSQAALAQYAAEFAIERKGWFDRLIDGVNRLPRPIMALGTIGLIVAAMWGDPIWFAERMQGLALVPEMLWWLMGAVVTFYFGARSQAKSEENQRSIAAVLAAAPKVASNIATLRAMRADSPGAADPKNDADASIQAVQAAQTRSLTPDTGEGLSAPHTGNQALDDAIVAWRSKNASTPTNER